MSKEPGTPPDRPVEWRVTRYTGGPRSKFVVVVARTAYDAWKCSGLTDEFGTLVPFSGVRCEQVEES